MKIRIEANNGFCSRFKIWDAETGEKVGMVLTAQLKVDNAGSVLQLLQMEPESRKLRISPWLRGKWDADQFIFEGGDWQPYEGVLEEQIPFHEINK